MNFPETISLGKNVLLRNNNTESLALLFMCIPFGG